MLLRIYSNCPGAESPPQCAHRGRRGAVLVEAAIIYPALLLLLVGLIVGGLGVYRYQLISAQAREAARWAAVHGQGWAQATGNSPPSSSDVRKSAVDPLAVGMERSRLIVHVEWIDGATGKAQDWDKSSRAPTSTASDGRIVSNRVRVTVTYQWFPEAYFAGPYAMTSISEMAMSF